MLAIPVIVMLVYFLVSSGKGTNNLFTGVLWQDEVEERIAMF